MKDDLALSIVEEDVQEGFSINDDKTAEWALKVITEEKAEAQRYINVCETWIAEYRLKAQKAQERFETKTSYLKQQLQEYFATVPHKATKTQETYKLPSGTLKLKFGKPEFIRDEKVLAKFLKDNGFKDYYEEVIKPKWAELKEVVTVSGDKVITADGEIVEGVTVQEKPASFEVEI